MGSYLSAADQVPGSRPRTTIAPTVVTRDGEVVLALGAAGGLRILSAIVQTISRYIDQGHAPDEAVALPRVHPVSGDAESSERTTYDEQINLEMTPERGWSPRCRLGRHGHGCQLPYPIIIPGEQLCERA
jgi:gamma-glutamyltranspeptidase/glutathione hydrolase